MLIPTHDRLEVTPLPKDWSAPPPGRVLCFAPHPDDESAGPGGALALHRRQGDPVRVVLATDGVAGDPKRLYDPADYARVRRSETRAGMAALGIDDVAFWGFLDSAVITDGDIDGIAGMVAREVEQFGPQVVYAPWEGEGHSDHRALYCAVLRGLRRSSFAGIYLGYEIWNAMVPDAILDISGVVEIKRASMSCYASQLAYVDYMHPIFGLNAYRSMLFRAGKGYGEAYRVVNWRQANP